MLNYDLSVLEENTELIELLSGRVSDDLISVYMDINMVLIKSGYSNHLESLEQLSNAIDADEISGNQVGIVVDDILRESARVCLLSCGVHFDTDARIDKIYELLKAILEFDVTEDPQHLLDLIEISSTTGDALISVLAETTGIDEDTWMELLIEPPYETGIVDRITDLCTKAIEVDVSMDNDAGLDRKIAVLNSEMDARSTPSLESMYLASVARLDSLSMEEVVHEFYTMAFLANNDLESMESSLRDLIDDYYPDPFERIKAGQESVKKHALFKQNLASMSNE